MQHQNQGFMTEVEEKKITVKIDPLGNTKVEAHGFNGEGCTDATKAIEDVLAGGAGGIDRQLKPEWYQHGEADTEDHNEVRW